jgi:hypothetical protein
MSNTRLNDEYRKMIHQAFINVITKKLMESAVMLDLLDDPEVIEMGKRRLANDLVMFMRLVGQMQSEAENGVDPLHHFLGRQSENIPNALADDIRKIMDSLVEDKKTH